MTFDFTQLCVSRGRVVSKTWEGKFPRKSGGRLGSCSGRPHRDRIGSDGSGTKCTDLSLTVRAGSSESVAFWLEVVPPIPAGLSLLPKAPWVGRAWRRLGGNGCVRTNLGTGFHRSAFEDVAPDRTEQCSEFDLTKFTEAGGPGSLHA